MPDKMASHWNIRGEVDGYIPKFWGMFLFPTASVVMLLLFLLIPLIDPLRKNIELFRKYYNGFIVIMTAFLFYIDVLMILWNLKIAFNMTQLLSPAFGVLFYYAGVLTENAKRNWFIGIRTPWTLMNDTVWEKTHKRGGKLFKIVGIAAFFGIIFKEIALLFTVISAVVIAIYTIVYSYFEYQKQMKKKFK